MPDKMSDEKEICFEPMALKYHHSYGSTADDERSYYKVSDRLAKEIKGAYKPDQYHNPANPEAHYKLPDQRYGIKQKER